MECVKEKRNIKVTLAYDGSAFSGWQRVNNVTEGRPAIQGLLEDTIAKLYGKNIEIIGSGRTDAGVHALGQVANFFLDTARKEEEIKRELNECLPKELQIVKAEFAGPKFHSRFDAKKKTYLYRFDVRERELVFTRKYTYPVYQMLDIEKMRKAANYLVGTHDFKAFCTDRKDGKTTTRTIYEIRIEEAVNSYGGEEVRIYVTGSGFLYNMVRIISGTLLEVGLLQRTAESVEKVRDTRDRSNAGITLSSQGLYLTEVFY